MLNIAKRTLKVAEALLKTANGDTKAIAAKLNMVSRAINSGKLTPEQLQQASKLLIDLSSQLAKLQ